MCLIVTGDVDRGLTNVNTRSLRQFGTVDEPYCSSLESKVCLMVSFVCCLHMGIQNDYMEGPGSATIK